MSYDEITNELIARDQELINNGGYNGAVVEEASNARKNIAIINLCVYGICRYNKLNVPYYSKEFINYVIDNLEMFLEHGSIPSFMQEYYIDVLNRGNVDYLNNFIAKRNIEENGQEKGRRITKSTAAGRAFSDSEAAFASVLILPAMLALIYISVVVIYFVFFYNGG